jgi:hypothetical protein
VLIEMNWSGTGSGSGSGIAVGSVIVNPICDGASVLLGGFESILDLFPRLDQAGGRASCQPDIDFLTMRLSRNHDLSTPSTTSNVA